MGYFFALSSLKFPLGIHLYLNIIPVLIGLYFFSTNTKKHLKLFWPFLAMLMINLVVLLTNYEPKSTLRIIQLFAMINFSFFIAQKWSEKNSKDFALVTTILASILIVLEIIYIGPDGIKDFLGFKLPRYMGLLGESNYSAIILALNSMLLIRFKRYYLLIINLITLFLLASRTGFLVVLIFAFLNLLVSKYPRFNRIIKYFILSLSLTPVLLWMIWKFAPMSSIELIEKLSNGRFFLWIPYIDMGISNVFGIGYFKGWANYSEYLTPYKQLADSIRGYQLNEQHNIFIQVFSEFGPICYSLFIYQIYKLATIRENNNIYLFSILIGYSFLNGLSDYVLYLIIGFSLNDVDLKIEKSKILELIERKMGRRIETH